MESSIHLVCSVLLVLAIGAAPSLADGGTFQGCYNNKAERALKAHFQELSLLQSPGLCIDVCTRNGFEYAGLTGTKCYCDRELRHKSRADETVCNIPCEGAPSEKCGGEWAMSVHKTEVQKLKNHVQYKGCYRDKVEKRQLMSYHVDLQDVLTPSLCLDICTLKGSVYAGLQHGSQCYCGNTIRDEDSVPDEECDTKCQGDPSQKCGGNLRNAVLATNREATSIADLPDNDYLGCFQDQEKTPLLQGFFLDLPYILTPHLCVKLCKHKGFEYAGLKEKSQCFCGNEKIPETAKLDEDMCSKKCSGLQNLVCGGEGRATIYRTYKESMRNDLKVKEMYMQRTNGDEDY